MGIPRRAPHICVSKDLSSDTNITIMKLLPKELIEAAVLIIEKRRIHNV